MTEGPFSRDPFTQRPTGDRNSLIPERVGDYRRAHNAADTDTDRAAIHHTLGSGPNQSAPGNHKHDDLYASKNLILNTTDFRVNGFTGNLQLLKNSRVITLGFELNTPAGGVGGGVAMALMGVGWKPYNVYLGLFAVAGYDAATGNWVPCYLLPSGHLVVAIGRAAGTTTVGGISYMSDS